MTTANAPQADPTDAINHFWHDSLAEADPEVFGAIRNELGRQRDRIELIASENIASKAVLEATGSVFTNKYAEGYPGRRYYGGCEYADVVETLAIERAKRLFGCEFANVQPNSGSQMNQAVFFALLNPGDTFMGLNLSAGGHLTHGSPVNMSGKWFNAVPYGVRKDDQRLDMDEVRRIAHEHKPKLIIAGATAYPRHWDFAAFREIADEVGAYLLADMSHFSGLVAGGAHPSPFPHAHVVTTSVVENAKALAASLEESGLRIVSGGTDNHLMLVDLTPKDVTGKAAEKGLDRAYLTCNKNGIPFDTRSPFVTSGVRLGTPAGTTRGFGPAEFRKIGELIAEVVEGLAKNGDEGDAQVEESVRRRVSELCAAFPVYPGR